MDYYRAAEILNSPETIDVFYEGMNVWIKSLNDDRKSAIVAPATEGEPEMMVPLDQLKEM